MVILMRFFFKDLVNLSGYSYKCITKIQRHFKLYKHKKHHFLFIFRVLDFSFGLIFFRFILSGHLLKLRFFTVYQ